MTGRKRRKLLLVEYFYVYGTYMYVCMYVFMYVCMYACMYVRMYMYVCAIIIIIIIIIIVIIFIIIIFLEELVITMHPLLYMKMMNRVSFFVIFYCFIVFIVDSDCTTANNESITTGKI